MTKERIETIIQENMQKIYIYCVRRLENTAVAEDVASDIIVELLRSYGNIKNDEAVYGYMWGVANNLCKNYLPTKAILTYFSYSAQSTSPRFFKLRMLTFLLFLDNSM